MRHQMIQLKVVFLLGFGLTFGSKAHSQTDSMVSDFSMMVASSTLSDMIKAKNHKVLIGNKSFSYQDSSGGQTVNASAEGLALSTGFSVSTSNFGENGDLSISGGLNGLTLRMDKLSFAATISVNTDPNSPPLNTQIKGQCTGVEVIFLLPVKVDVNAKLDSQSLQMSINSWQWDIATVPYLWMVKSCEGPSGMSDFLKQKVFQKFVGSDQAKQVVQSEVQGVLNSSTANVMEQMFSQSFAGMKSTFKVEKFNWTKDTFTFDGAVTLKAPKACNSFVLSGKTRVALDTATRATLKLMQIMFPEETVMKLMGCSHDLGNITFDSTTADIPDFVDLMKNQTNQFYVWPDLQRFPASQSFLMKTRTTDKLNLLPVQATAGFTGTLTTQITSYWSYQEGSYVTFWTPVTASVKANIEGDKMVFTMTGAKNVKLSYRFERSVTDKTIDTTKFDQPVQDYMSKLKYSWSLPSLQLPNGSKFTPSQLNTVTGKAWIFTMKN